MSVTQQNYYRGKRVNSPPTPNSKMKQFNDKGEQNFTYFFIPSLHNANKAFLLPPVSQRRSSSLTSVFQEEYIILYM